MYVCVCVCIYYIILRYIKRKKRSLKDEKLHSMDIDNIFIQIEYTSIFAEYLYKKRRFYMKYLKNVSYTLAHK